MKALIIILLILLLILLLPVGADAAFDNAGGRVRVRAGPFSFKVFSLPKEEKPKKKKKKDRKPKEEKEKHKKEHRKKKLTVKDILAIAKMGLRALGRFFRHLSVDLVRLHLVFGGDDPYSSAMNYGYLSAGLGAVTPLAERAFRIKKRDIELGVDFDRPDLGYDVRLILTIQIWEILGIAFAFLFAFLKYKLKQRREQRRKERKEQHGKPVQPGERSAQRDHEQDEGHGGREHRRRRADHVA